MKLEGIHHITAVTADARMTLDFYTRVLGLRLVEKSVNQDDPTAGPHARRPPRPLGGHQCR